MRGDGEGGVASEVAEKLGAYVDGELSPTEREAIESLLERDHSCREIVQSFRFLDDAARRESVPAVGAGEWARIWEAIQQQKDVPASSGEPRTATAGSRDGKILRVHWLYRAAAVAAAIALVVVGLQLIQPSVSENEVVRPDAPPSQEATSETELDIDVPDTDREPGIAHKEGDAPDEIEGSFVRYSDF